MLCDNCGKEPARIHYKEMKDNKVTEYHLCEKCASEKGIQIPSEKESFSMSNILAGMADEVDSDMTRCPGCGLAYGEFRETGRLGCSQCYAAFKDQLKPLLRRIHGSNVHTGKSPRASENLFQRRREMETLRTELNRAIDSEEFEKAAEIRDKIKNLENDKE